MPLFDEYIFVDWSAANKETSRVARKDAIWVGRCLGTAQITTKYCRTRKAAITIVKDYLLDAVNHGRRVLVGFDFPYCYPVGLSKALSLPTEITAWRNIWEHVSHSIIDTPTNANNRFQVAAAMNVKIGAMESMGPFWGRQEATIAPPLSTKRPFRYPLTTAVPGLELKEFRITEMRLKAGGINGIQPAWKLNGRGSVGGQALVGIPCLEALRFDTDLAPHSQIWPFETDFTNTPGKGRHPFILHVEIWPVIGDVRVRELLSQGPIKIKDEAQVFAMCEWASKKDAANALGVWLDRPPHLTDEERDICVNEEGWILGTPNQ